MKPSEAMQALVEMCRGTEYENEHKSVQHSVREHYLFGQEHLVRTVNSIYVNKVGWSRDHATLAEAVEEMRLKIAPNTVPDQSDEPDC